MQFTRTQIINHLKKHQTATVPILSRSLNLTLGNIRHHIKELEKQRVVEAIGNLPVTGRGRPTKIYGLTTGALDHNIDSLAAVLLDMLLVDRDKVKSVCQEIATGMAQDFQRRSNLLHNLNQAIEWLNQRQYQARWEASATGPRVILGHCPYYAILEANPDICKVDTALVSQLVGFEMLQSEKMERRVKGGIGCVFVRI